MCERDAGSCHFGHASLAEWDADTLLKNVSKLLSGITNR